MPGFVKTPADERRWKRAKAAVARSREKAQSEFTEQDWGLVTTIFKAMKNKVSGAAAKDVKPKAIDQIPQKPNNVRIRAKNIAKALAKGLDEKHQRVKLVDSAMLAKMSSSVFWRRLTEQFFKGLKFDPNEHTVVQIGAKTAKLKDGGVRVRKAFVVAPAGMKTYFVAVAVQQPGQEHPTLYSLRVEAAKKLLPLYFTKPEVTKKDIMRLFPEVKGSVEGWKGIVQVAFVTAHVEYVGDMFGLPSVRNLLSSNIVDAEAEKISMAELSKAQAAKNAKPAEAYFQGATRGGTVVGDDFFVLVRKDAFRVPVKELKDFKLSAASGEEGSEVTLADGEQPPSDMTISNLKQIIRDAEELLSRLDEHMELMGWAEDKISQAKVAVDSVKNYVLNDFGDQPSGTEVTLDQLHAYVDALPLPASVAIALRERALEPKTPKQIEDWAMYALAHSKGWKSASEVAARIKVPVKSVSSALSRLASQHRVRSQSGKYAQAR